MIRRLARLVHRETGQVTAEFDLTDYTPREIDRWYLDLLAKVDFEKYRLEWETTP